MSEYHFPIPGVDDEKISFITRRHWASMLGSFFLIFFMVVLPLALITGLTIYANIAISGTVRMAMILFGSVYYLIVASFSLVVWISYYYNIFIISEDEIIDINQEGIFDRKINQISVVRIQDVSGEIKGFLPTLFTYGNVIAESAGEKTQTYVIRDIPNPLEVADRIIELHNEELLKAERKKQFLTAEGDLQVHETPPGKIIGEFQKAIQKEMPVIPPVTPPPLPPSQNISQGEASSDDLNSGGEVKL